MDQRTCSVPFCDKPFVARGWCTAHWAQWRKRNPLPVKSGVCRVEGCDRGGKMRRGMCELHYDRWKKHGDPATPLPTRSDLFWAQVTKSSGCWLWTGYANLNGYGEFAEFMAHRFAYTEIVGSIPPGMTLDHLCRVHACVRPSHLEPVSRGENVRRGDSGAHNRIKTHCAQGHPYDEANTRWYGPGWRACRTCESWRYRHRPAA